MYQGAKGNMVYSGWGEAVLPRLTAWGLDKRLPGVATVLLTLMVAQVLAVLTWGLLPQPDVKEAQLPVAGRSAVVRSGATQQNQIQQISQWHLFGEAQKAAPKTVAKVTEAPDTRLNLQLKGVLATGDTVIARAIISDGKGTEDAYAINDNLPGNAVLREIYADRVILEYRGRLETLRLPKEASAVVELASTASSGSASRAGLSSQSSPVNSINNTENSALLRQYREALINAPQSLMDLVQAAPVTDKDTGKLKGYRIRPGKDKKLLGQFGLLSGDVVTAVNGVTLDNPIKALEILRDLTTASSVSLDVERKGMLQSFSFQIE